MLVGWFPKAVNIFGCGAKLFSFACPWSSSLYFGWQIGQGRRGGHVTGMLRVEDTAHIDTGASRRKLIQTTGVDPDAEGSAQSEEERIEEEKLLQEIRNLRLRKD